MFISPDIHGIDHLLFSSLQYLKLCLIKIPLDLPHNYQIRITPKTNSLRRLYRPREAHRCSMYAQRFGHGVGNLVGFTSRGVGVLRRTGPPHGGAHAGKNAAALWARSGDAVTDCCANPLATGPATSRQTILKWREPTDVRQSSLAPFASDIVVVVDHRVLALSQILVRASYGATSIGRHPCAKSRWQE
jgi:hypothetical protein